ncbi:MAG: bifunctional diaminohydroxyphosphoribosylaminopyrimidine deaminase/5-amino-6-(5-phosphoribosylamino)uracil reductase RibD [Candidatus Binatia bacterium]
MARLSATADHSWMRLACEQARRGLGRTAPNPAVGCILVRGGREIGRGYHRGAGKPHAEVEALRVAGKGARGSTAYVSLEPCCHQARTGPCTSAILEAGVVRVVVGCLDPDPRVQGRGVSALTESGVRVDVGVLREECEDLIRGFKHWVRTGTPLVHLKLAASLDGRIAVRGGESKWISSRESRKLVQEFRARCDAVLVGSGTVLADDPRLSCRLRGSTNPLRIIMDRRLRTPPMARVIEGRGKCLLVCSPAAARGTAGRILRSTGAELLAMDSRGPKGWRRLLAELGRRGLHEILVEGGAGVATSMIRAGVVNRVTFFYNPRLIGGDGMPMLESLGVRDPAVAPRLIEISVTRSGDDIVWSGLVKP